MYVKYTVQFTECVLSLALSETKTNLFLQPYKCKKKTLEKNKQETHFKALLCQSLSYILGKKQHLHVKQIYPFNHYISF
jgi:hypothetical protein